jgi:hypothetical protein
MAVKIDGGTAAVTSLGWTRQSSSLRFPKQQNSAPTDHPSLQTLRLFVRRSATDEELFAFDYELSFNLAKSSADAGNM